MAKYAQLPSGEYVEFPDAWTESQMDEAIYRDFADQFPDRQPKSPGILEQLSVAQDTAAGMLKTGASETSRAVMQAIEGGGQDYSALSTPGVRDMRTGLPVQKPAFEEGLDAVSTAQPQLNTAEDIYRAADIMGVTPSQEEANVAGLEKLGIAAITNLPGGVLKHIGEMGRPLPYPKELGQRPPGLADLLSGVGESILEKGKEWQEGVTPQGSEFLSPMDPRRAVMGGLESTGTMLPAFATAPMTKGRSVLPIIGAGTSGMATKELEDAGLSKPVAAMVGAIKGWGIEAGTEMIPVKILFRNWGDDVVKEALKYVLAESSTEYLAEGLDAAVDKLSINPDMTWGEVVTRMQQLTAQLPVALSTTAAAGKVAQAGTEYLQKSQQEQQMQDLLHQLAQEQALSSMRPDQGVSPAQTTQRPDQVGPPAKGRATDQILEQLNKQLQSTQAAKDLGGRASGAQQLTEEEAATEQMRILDERMKAAQAQKKARETDLAYGEHEAKKEQQLAAQKEKDRQDATVQKELQDAADVAAYQKQQREFDASRKPTMAQAFEDAVQKAVTKTPLVAAEDDAALESDAQQKDLQPDAEGNVELVHYSNTAGLTELDPAMYGKGIKGAEWRRKANDPVNWVDRTYFYVGEPTTREPALGPHEYRVKVPVGSLYDLRADPLGLKEQATEGFSVNVNLFERKVKEAGFKGTWVTAPHGKVAVVFEKTQPTPVTRVAKDRPGGATAEFFTKMTLGEDGKPNTTYTPLLKDAEQKTEFVQEYSKHRGNFDNHIRASIPGFGEVQVLTGDALVSTYGKGAEVLDVGASEGSWIKAITANSNGNIKTTGVEPLKAMADFFNQHSKVPGSQIRMDAWGDTGWTEPDGTIINPFPTNKKYDVVHEAMTFQFIDNNRADQIARVKSVLKPDGVFLTEEKLKDDGTPEYKEREAQKDKYKSQYFTEKAIKNKAKDTLVVGMNDNMVTKEELEQTLMENFDHVVEYWNAGNFSGYMASDSRNALNKLLDNLGDTSSEYSSIPEPRWVSEEGVPAQVGKPQAGPQEPVGPDQGGQIPAFLKQQASAKTRTYSVMANIDLAGDLPMAPLVAAKTEFDSDLHLIKQADEAHVRQLYREQGRDYRLVNKTEHETLRTLMTILETQGMPLKAATLGARFFMVGMYSVQGRHAVIDKAYGNQAFLSLSRDVINNDMTNANARTTAAFILAHEIGHGVDIRDESSSGNKNRGFSMASPLFRIDDMKSMSPIMQELFDAYQNNALGLSSMLQYPFGKMVRLHSVSTTDAKEYIKLSNFMQKEAFAQLFAIYYTFGRTTKGKAALGKVMPEAMTFMEELHNALETDATTLDERDRSVRRVFRLDTGDRVADATPGRVERDIKQSPAGQQAGARVQEVPGRTGRTAEERTDDVASSDVLESAYGEPPFMALNSDMAALPPGGFTVPDQDLKDRIATKLQDKFQRLYVAEKAIREQGGDVNIDIDTWAAEERFHGKVELDLRVLEEDHVEPLIAAMVEQKVTTEILDEYLLARHAPERNKAIAERRDDMPDGGSGQLTQDAIDARAALEAEYPGIEALAQRVWDILDMKRQKMVDFSLMDQDGIDIWEDAYKYYVPLKGFAEDAIDDAHPRVGAGFSIKGKESKAAIGRTTKSLSPTIQTIQDATESIIRARKNEVGLTFLELVRANPNEAYWKIFDEKNPDLEPAYRGGKVVMSPSAMANNPNYFGVKEDGKQLFIKLRDPLLAKAMQNLGVEKQDLFLRVMAVASRYLSTINTALDPVFIAGNFTRDLQTAVYNALAEQDLHDAKIDTKRIGRKIATEWRLAMRPMYRALRRKPVRAGDAWDKAAKEFMEDGAKTGFYNTRDIESQKRYVDHLMTMAHGGVVGTGMKIAKSVADMVSDINATVENGVRLAAYKNAREAMEKRGIPAGQARKRAAHFAKNLTVNFNRRGEVSSRLNSLYVFFNASVQGTAQFARTMLTMKKGPDGKKSLNFAQKVALSAVGVGYLWALINRARSDDDDDGRTYYDNIPSSVKERNFIIMKPDGRNYWSIPLPYGYNIFHVLGTTVSDTVHGPHGVVDGAIDLTMTVLGSFNPIGMSTDAEPGTAIIKTVLPSILTPGAEIVLNSNFWGGPIWREDRYNDRTPDAVLSMNAKPHFQMMSKFLNEITGGSMYEKGKIDWSPDSLEHLFETATGGPGRFVSQSAGMVEKLSVGIPLEARDIPFYSRFNKEPAGYRASAAYYQNRAQILAKEDAIKGLRGAERTEFRKENEHFMPLVRKVHQVDERLTGLRIKRDRELSKTEDKAELARIKKDYQKRMDVEYNRVNRLWNETIEQR